MKPFKLLTGGFAALLDWTSGGRRVIPCRPDRASTLTWGEVRRAAVALRGPGTKVRIWDDGSGHLLLPPPYHEEEYEYSYEYSFDNELQLRRLLPSLGTITLEEWESGRYPVKKKAPKGSLDLSSAHEIVASWPGWKQDLAKQVLRPSKPPTKSEPKAKKASEKPVCCGHCAEYPADTWDVCVCGCGSCDCPKDGGNEA